MPPPYQQSGGATPIEVGFAGPAPQRRVTVLFRIFLAIPQIIVLYILTIAAEFVAIIGWFGALFTGRLPEFAVEFLSGVLRWQARVNAYALLLTDQYPPFALEDVDYPVRVVTSRGQLNRLAVFFRLILAFPAAIVVGVLTYGTYTIVLLVTWLIVLITGRMPESLHFAISAVLRYSLRYIGYLLLLTAEYPSGLFGDQPGPGDLSGTAPYPSAGYLAAGYPQAGPGYRPAPGFSSAAGFPPSPAQPTAEGTRPGGTDVGLGRASSVSLGRALRHASAERLWHQPGGVLRRSAARLRDGPGRRVRRPAGPGLRRAGPTLRDADDRLAGPRRPAVAARAVAVIEAARHLLHRPRRAGHGRLHRDRRRRGQQCEQQHGEPGGRAQRDNGGIRQAGHRGGQVREPYDRV